MDDWEVMWKQADVAHFYVLSYHKWLRKTINTAIQNSEHKAEKRKKELLNII
jgi:hypothetical protein